MNNAAATGRQKKRPAGHRVRDAFYSPKVAPYVFVLPFVLTFLIFFLYPILNTVVMSLQEVNIGRTEFVGLANYQRLIGNTTFYKAVSNTLIYTALTLLLLIPFPLLFACMLNSKSMKFANVFKSVLFIPLLTSVVVAGITFRFMFNETDTALANSILRLLGMPKVRWLSVRWPAMAVLVTLACWRWTGINILYFMSGLNSIPQDMYEAASIDGANAWKQFLHISLPSLKPTMVYVLTISVYGGLAMFTESQMLWAGKSSPQNIGLTIIGFIYQNGIEKNDLGYASAVGLALLVVTLAVNMIQLRASGTLGKGRE